MVTKTDLGGWVRLPRGKYENFLAETTSAPNLRSYQRNVDDGHLTAFVGAEARAGGPCWHLSISHRTNEARPKPGRYPTWDEIKDARYRLMPADIYVAQILPPPSEFLSAHETTFHLWQIPEEVGRG
jgi:hypothetical protein